MAEKTRYSDAELEEFRAIIMEKLELAQRDYELLKASLTGADGMIPMIHHQRIKFWKKGPIPCLKKKLHVWRNVSLSLFRGFRLHWYVLRIKRMVFVVKPVS